MVIKPNYDNIEITVKKETYSEEVIYKCFYWYSAKYDVSIDSNAEYYIINIAKPSDISVQDIEKKVRRDLIDFKLRDIISKETQTIRELIIAKAFAYYDTEDDQFSENDISNPH